MLAPARRWMAFEDRAIPPEGPACGVRLGLQGTARHASCTTAWPRSWRGRRRLRAPCACATLRPSTRSSPTYDTSTPWPEHLNLPSGLTLRPVSTVRVTLNPRVMRTQRGGVKVGGVTLMPRSSHSRSAARSHRGHSVTRLTVSPNRDVRPHFRWEVAAIRS